MTPFCFFCGGNAQLDFIAQPRPLVVSELPCDNCTEMRGDGVAVFEVTETDPGCDNVKLQDGVWYTGRWTVIHEQEVGPLFGSRAADVLKYKCACLRADNYKKVHLDHYPWRTIQ